MEDDTVVSCQGGTGSSKVPLPVNGGGHVCVVILSRRGVDEFLVIDRALKSTAFAGGELVLDWSIDRGAFVECKA